MYNPTQMVDILKELHQKDAVNTKVGQAMASNTALYSGDTGQNILQIGSTEEKREVKKDDKGFNFFKKK